jgi:hypothetical protein
MKITIQVENVLHQKAKDYLTQELKQLLNDNKNECIQTFLQGLKTNSTDYSLWKATKKIKQVKKPSPRLRTSQVNWAGSKCRKSTRFR